MFAEISGFSFAIIVNYFLYFRKKIGFTEQKRFNFGVDE